MDIQRRHVRLRDEALRERAMNNATRIFHDGDLPPSCRDAFLSHYDEIRRRCGPFAGVDGLTLVAIDESGVAATAFLPRGDGLEVAVVGRHRMAHVWLQSPSVALRHLLIVMGKDRRYRVLDLRTEHGLIDERGQALRSFSADGPVFFQIENTSFVALPTSVPIAWPADALEAWNAFPARTYDGVPFRHRPRRRFQVEDGDEAQTLVEIGPSVVNAHRILATGTPVGSIDIRSPRGHASLMVDEESLHAGVLLGRYERCDNGGLDLLGVRSLSRVHALLLKVDGKLHVIDTASTCGIEVRGRPVRAHAMTAGENVLLGRGAAIRWRPVD
jgi:hypothetical protein